jgi:predicted acyl esterase
VPSRFSQDAPPNWMTFEAMERWEDVQSFPNSNTGEHEAHVTRTVPATMKTHHGPETASHVILPLLPRR